MRGYEGQTGTRHLSSGRLSKTQSRTDVNNIRDKKKKKISKKNFHLSSLQQEQSEDVHTFLIKLPETSYFLWLQETSEITCFLWQSQIQQLEYNYFPDLESFSKCSFTIEAVIKGFKTTKWLKTQNLQLGKREGLHPVPPASKGSCL